MSGQNIPSLLDKLGQAGLELTDKIREAHGLVKDLKRYIAEAREITGRQVEHEVEVEVKRQLESFGTYLAGQREDAVARVIASFDDLKERLLGAVAQQRNPKLLSIPEVVDKLTAPRCPNCGDVAEAFSAVRGNGEPEPGCRAICWGCSSINVYVSPTKLRLATADEVEQSLCDPIVLRFFQERPNAISVDDARAMLAAR